MHRWPCPYHVPAGFAFRFAMPCRQNIHRVLPVTGTSVSVSAAKTRVALPFPLPRGADATAQMAAARRGRRIYRWVVWAVCVVVRFWQEREPEGRSVYPTKTRAFYCVYTKFMVGSSAKTSLVRQHKVGVRGTFLGTGRGGAALNRLWRSCYSCERLSTQLWL